MKRNLFWIKISLMCGFLLPQIADAAHLCHPYTANSVTYQNPCTVTGQSVDLVQAICPSRGQVSDVHITVMPICSGSNTSWALSHPVVSYIKYCWCIRIEPTMSTPYLAYTFTSGSSCLTGCADACATALTATSPVGRQYLLGSVRF